MQIKLFPVYCHIICIWRQFFARKNSCFPLQKLSYNTGPHLEVNILQFIFKRRLLYEEVNIATFKELGVEVRNGEMRLQTELVDCCQESSGTPSMKKQLLYRPGQAMIVPWGWNFQISRQAAYEGGKIVSHTHRTPLHPGNNPFTLFCQMLSRTQGHSAVGRDKSMKISKDTNGKRTSDLLARRAVPQLNAPKFLRWFIHGWAYNITIITVLWSLNTTLFLKVKNNMIRLVQWTSSGWV